MNIFTKDVSILEYHSKIKERKKKKTGNEIDPLDKLFKELDYKLTFELKDKSLLQHFLIENRIPFSIINNEQNKIELIDVVQSKRFFINFEIYRNFADIKLTDDGVDIIVYDHHYLNFSEKLSIKLLEYANIKLIYAGPIEYDLNRRASKKNRDFYLYEK